MPDYQIRSTIEFRKQIKKLTKETRTRFRVQINRLKQNPFIGKPLGLKHLRELKNKGVRLYYLVYEKQITILLVLVSNKKEQKKYIEFIKNNLKSFQKIIEKYK